MYFLSSGVKGRMYLLNVGGKSVSPLHRQPTEGQLSKWTNLMKGWQYRWFTLDPDSGMLGYYVVSK